MVFTDTGPKTDQNRCPTRVLMDIREMVKAAHKCGIRILMDAVINHTALSLPQIPKWPDEWVRTSPNLPTKGMKPL
ncbi:MAG: hypothetical protein IPP49_07040 [Saprospiraceae bacterium]|nr:hypothetical protein [Saprospiraceae bacterium]